MYVKIYITILLLLNLINIFILISISAKFNWGTEINSLNVDYE